MRYELRIMSYELIGYTEKLGVTKEKDWESNNLPPYLLLFLFISTLFLVIASVFICVTKKCINEKSAVPFPVFGFGHQG